MNNWFTSDIHFYHNNIIKYSNRPFNDVNHMNDSLINNWNSVVGENDTVYSLGDFAFAKVGKILEILSQLKGNIHLINGNHDEEIIKNAKQLLDSGYVKSISDYKEIRVDGQFICLFHYGSRVWNKSHRGSWQLYGHSHGTLPPYGKSVDVGVDAPFVTGKAEYRPLSFDEVSKFMKSRKIEIADQHEIRDSK